MTFLYVFFFISNSLHVREALNRLYNQLLIIDDNLMPYMFFEIYEARILQMTIQRQYAKQMLSFL